ncbi:MAG: CehA/McbA family metallohydrolase [Planctomycetes bacterium]|nr:CehA/McbA family metallohydrolase [Planctomycetota bacterium]
MLILGLKMNIAFEDKCSCVIRAAIRTALAILLLVVIIGLQNESLLAHENTLSSYTRSLHSEDADQGENNEVSVSDQSTDNTCCQLTLNLIDATTKESLPGLLRITMSDGHTVAIEDLFDRGTGLRKQHPTRDWHVILKSTTISVPRERLKIEAFSGLETELARKTIDLTDKSSAEITLPLVRFHNAVTNNWRNGNTHLHLMSLSRDQADQYLKSISQADGLELVFVSYLRRAKAERNYISNTYNKQQLRQLSGNGVMFDYGEEHRHNFGSGGEGYGHVMFLNIKELIRPVSIGPGIMGEGMDWPTLRQGIDKARRDGATTIWCHNAFGFEEVPDWIAGILDAHNIFDGGSRGSYEDTFYRFMNIGLRVPFSTGTDWFIYDFSRVYVEVDEPLTVERWLNGLEKGRTFITNGPLLKFSLDKYNPGDVIRLTQPQELNISSCAIGRGDFQTIEVIHNGRVVQSAPSRLVDGHFKARITGPLLISEPGWIALRINSGQKNELGAPLFGHTSAIYIELDGKTIFKPEAARKLINNMNEAMRTIREKANFADDKQADNIINIYREGIASLQKQLEKQ